MNWIVYDPISKSPINPITRERIDAQLPGNWLTYEEAARHGTTGLVINNDLFFIDIDHCCDPELGWTPLAQEICAMFPGAYVEISMSGSGLHIIGRCQKLLEHKCKNTTLGIELYTSGRYCAVTGISAIGSMDTDHTAAVQALIDKYFAVNGAEYQHLVVVDWDGYTDDRELIQAACRSKPVFSSGATFEDLWTGNAEPLGRAYPDSFKGTRPYDASSADSALAQHLAFWTGNDAPRIERLMRMSALVRDKWDRHSSYLTTTIDKACARQTKWHKRAAQPTGAVQELRSGHQFLSADQQLDHFRGCVYVCDAHKVLVPWGDLLNQDRFRAMFGGFIFNLDSLNNKTTTNAWTAFTESQALSFPKAHRQCFKPLQPEALVETLEDGTTRVNTWRDPKVRRIKADVSPFLIHLEKLLPDASDRATVLNYAAAIVQYQGVKFQWAPIIQGAPGNGKSLISRCVSYTVGKQYTFFPRAKELAERFNDWLVGRVFIGVEDVYFPKKKLDAIEVLKPMVTATSEGYEIEPKGGQKFMYELVCNFILNTNHKDAIRKEEDDRRWAIFYCAQQSKSDLHRDGMTGGYFPKLYNWLKADGYAAVAEYLWMYPIPAGWVDEVACYRAPDTSSTAEAVTLGRGGIEQEILEAVESGRLGFCGGWISSTAVDKLLDEHRSARQIPRTRRRGVLQSLGYDYHPALHDGRSTRVTTIDGCKPKLYVRMDNPGLLAIARPADVVATYENSQRMG